MIAVCQYDPKLRMSIAWLRLLLPVLAGALMGLAWPTGARAQETIPVITISARSISPGGTILVTLANHRPGTFCVGIDGPGANFALNLAPNVHQNLGTIVVAADGTGASAVTVPSFLTAGDYQIIVGGCAPHPDLGPLDWDATAEIFVGPPPPLTSEPHPRTTWYFAEGSTQPPFETWLHLSNPSTTQTATATITFFAFPAVAPLTVKIPPIHRTSIFLNQQLPPIPFGMRVDSDLPIVAERSMYRFGGRGGTNTIGTQQ